MASQRGPRSPAPQRTLCIKGSQRAAASFQALVGRHCSAQKGHAERAFDERSMRVLCESGPTNSGGHMYAYLGENPKLRADPQPEGQGTGRSEQGAGLVAALDREARAALTHRVETPRSDEVS